MPGNCSYPRLPDSIWLTILKYLDSNELLSLLDSYHCSHKSEAEKSGSNDPVETIGRVAGDPELWCEIRWTGQTLAELKRLVKHLGPHTTFLSISGTSKARKRTQNNSLFVSGSFLQSLKLRCVNLRRIKFHRCVLDYNTRPFQGALPRSTEWLDVDDIEFINKPVTTSKLNSPFHNVAKFNPNLKRVHVAEPYSEDTSWISISEWFQQMSDLYGKKKPLQFYTVSEERLPWFEEMKQLLAPAILMDIDRLDLLDFDPNNQH